MLPYADLWREQPLLSQSKPFLRQHFKGSKLKHVSHRAGVHYVGAVRNDKGNVDAVEHLGVPAKRGGYVEAIGDNAFDLARSFAINAIKPISRLFVMIEPHRDAGIDAPRHVLHGQGTV